MRISLLCLMFFCSLSAPHPLLRANSQPYQESIESSRSSSRRGGSDPRGAEIQWEKVEELVQENRLRRAIREAGRLVDTWPEHPLAVQAQRLKADLLFARERYADAFNAYQALIDGYAGRFAYDEILRQQLECARLLEHRDYSAFFGLTTYQQPLEAVPLYRQLLTNAPHIREAPQILYDIGAIYLRRHKYAEAIQEFNLLEQRYPQSPLASESSLRVADAYAQMHRQNPSDMRPMEGELATLNLFLLRYPDHPEVANVRLRRRQVYEQIAEHRFQQAHFYAEVMNRPDAARVAFDSLLTQFPDSEWTAEARARILELSEADNEPR